MPRVLVDLGPLRQHRDFRLLISGQLVSLLGSNLTLVAVPYQVYLLTHSSLWVGTASLLQLPPLVAGSLWGGVLGDRFDRRVLFVASSLVLALLSAALALNVHGGDLASLLSLAALAAGAGGFAGPVRTATIPILVGADELVAAYSVNQVIVNIAAVVGAAVAGVLIAVVGLTACYALDAASFAVLALATARMRPLPPSGEHADVPLSRALVDGFRYIRDNPIAQAVYLVDLTAMVFGLPRALFPAVALTIYHGGARTVGLLYAAPGVGALVMALGTGWIAHVRRRGRLVIVVVVGWGLSMALFGLVPTAAVGLACLAVAGATDVISTVLRNTILQNAITDEYRSRVSAIQLAVVTGGPRLGDLEAGAVAAATSTEFSIVSGGLACILGALLLARWRPTFWHASADR
ncbi:MAG: MFS transporter [Acidimicrobiales bacterium]